MGLTCQAGLREETLTIRIKLMATGFQQHYHYAPPAERIGQRDPSETATDHAHACSKCLCPTLVSFEIDLHPESISSNSLEIR
jgi:hypothetical protein